MFMNMPEACRWFGIIMPVMAVAMLILMLSCVFGRGGCRPPWRSDHRLSPGAETAMDVLKKRYASGEIGKDEYERIKKDLQ